MNEMALRWNVSFSFGFTEEGGKIGLAAGKDNVWGFDVPLHPDNHHHHLNPMQNNRDDKHMHPHTLIPFGSVTKPWTGLRILQHMENGKLALDDPAYKYVDPVLRKLWDTNLTALWGPDAAKVTIRHLLQMRSGFTDYNDTILEGMTMVKPGDDVGPEMYIRSASLSDGGSGRPGWVCKPDECGSYSGANFVLLGMALVYLDGGWSWHEFDQRTVIPQWLWDSNRYPHTSFLKFGRCLQYPGIAHQWAVPYIQPANSVANVTYTDLSASSCLNGWTMGNIASTGEDLATFFYDMYTLAPTGKGYVNSTTLEMMQQYKPLNDTWCYGPKGPGSCSYGLSLFKDQFAQDVWIFADANADADPDSVRVVGHPGEDWGSGVSPCGYNKAYKFGICVGYNSLTGMNCSMDSRWSDYMIDEATCKIYDAVLNVVGGPRLNCSLPVLSGWNFTTPPKPQICDWEFKARFFGPKEDPNKAHKKNHTNHTGIHSEEQFAYNDMLRLKHKRSRLLAKTMQHLEAQGRGLRQMKKVVDPQPRSFVI
jgi:CubicO group peptidase (beta-lactamase class C family)